jgi:hypothetical protein
MGRHHNRKYGVSPFGIVPGNHRTYTHVTHQRRLQRNLRKGKTSYITVSYLKGNYPAGVGMGMGTYGLGGIGLLGLLGAGVLGYTLFHKKSIGMNSFGLKRSWLPWKTSPIGVTTGIASAPIATGGVINSLATGTPIVHNRKVPIKERLLSKVTGRPVITNYH